MVLSLEGNVGFAVENCCMGNWLKGDAKSVPRWEKIGTKVHIPA